MRCRSLETIVRAGVRGYTCTREASIEEWEICCEFFFAFESDNRPKIIFLYFLLKVFFLHYSVTSSEKVDKENRYSEFSILSLPYPGCEFFKEFRDLGYTGEGLYFNWSQPFVDAQLVIPERTMSAKVASDWNNYRVRRKIHS